MAVSNFISQVWVAEILAQFQQAAVIPATINDYSDAGARLGNEIHVSEFSIPTVVDYATGTSGPRTIDPEDLTDSGLIIPLDNESAFGFLVDDVDAVQAAGGLGEVTASAVGALVEDADTNLGLALMTGGTASGVTAPTDGNSAFDAVLKVRTALSDLKVPPGGRTLLCNPLFSQMLLGADSKLSEVNTSGSPAGLRDATIGRLLGFNVVENALMSPGKAAFAAYHQSALGWASQLDKVESLRHPSKFADIIRGLHVYGMKVLRPTAILTYQAA